LVKRVVRIVLGIAVLAAFLFATFVGGFFFGAYDMTPLSRLLPQIENKIGELRGDPTPLEKDVALIETTFVQLRGTVMRPPGIDWTNGGALTVRGDELIIVDRRGRLYATDGTAPIRVLPNIGVPDNGYNAYESFSASAEGQEYIHIPSRLRYNDVIWVEAGAISGFALSYTFFERDTLCYGNRVAWLPAAPGTALDDIVAGPEDWTIVFQTTPCPPFNLTKPAIEGHFAGGRMAFRPPATLYFGSGFFGLDGVDSPDIGIQSNDSTIGKVIAIDLGTGESRIVSKGHRNLQGVALDKGGRLWVTEHGIRGGDELNLIREGGDYGWPSEGLGTLYSGLPVPGIPYGRHENFDPPVFAWLPSTAVSALAVIDGIDPSWDGDLLAGSLSSPEFGQSLWHIRIQDARAIFVERIKLGHRVRYVTQFGDRIAVWLDSNDLVLFDVTRRADPFEQVRGHLVANYEGETVETVLGVIESCSQCHSFDQNDHRAGPSLNGVVGRAVAGTSFTGYSEALRKLGGRWTPDVLAAYLVDPESVAPGTTMAASGLEEGTVLDALIDAMSRLDSDAEEDLTYN